MHGKRSTCIERLYNRQSLPHDSAHNSFQEMSREKRNICVRCVHSQNVDRFTADDVRRRRRKDDDKPRNRISSANSEFHLSKNRFRPFNINAQVTGTCYFQEDDRPVVKRKILQTESNKIRAQLKRDNETKKKKERGIDEESFSQEITGVKERSRNSQDLDDRDGTKLRRQRRGTEENTEAHERKEESIYREIDQLLENVCRKYSELKKRNRHRYPLTSGSTNIPSFASLTKYQFSGSGTVERIRRRYALNGSHFSNFSRLDRDGRNNQKLIYQKDASVQVGSNERVVNYQDLDEDNVKLSDFLLGLGNVSSTVDVSARPEFLTTEIQPLENKYQRVSNLEVLGSQKSSRISVTEKDGSFISGVERLFITRASSDKELEEEMDRMESRSYKSEILIEIDDLRNKSASDIILNNIVTTESTPVPNVMKDLLDNEFVVKESKPVDDEKLPGDVFFQVLKNDDGFIVLPRRCSDFDPVLTRKRSPITSSSPSNPVTSELLVPQSKENDRNKSAGQTTSQQPKGISKMSSNREDVTVKQYCKCDCMRDNVLVHDNVTQNVQVKEVNQRPETFTGRRKETLIKYCKCDCPDRNDKVTQMPIRVDRSVVVGDSLKCLADDCSRDEFVKVNHTGRTGNTNTSGGQGKIEFDDEIGRLREELRRMRDTSRPPLLKNTSSSRVGNKKPLSRCVCSLKKKFNKNKRK